MDPTTDDWMHLRNCEGLDPDLFFPELAVDAVVAEAQAIAVCAGCNVRAQCLARAIAAGEVVGVWGGLTAQQRRRLTTAEHPPRRRRRSSARHAASTSVPVAVGVARADCVG